MCIKVHSCPKCPKRVIDPFFCFHFLKVYTTTSSTEHLKSKHIIVNIAKLFDCLIKTRPLSFSIQMRSFNDRSQRLCFQLQLYRTFSYILNQQQINFKFCQGMEVCAQSSVNNLVTVYYAKVAPIVYSNLLQRASCVA